MATWIIRQAAVITFLTFLVWLAFAAFFPNDRLDLTETIFVWAMIGIALFACRSAVRALSKRRTRPSKVRLGK
jgi:hypothetical protein